MTKMPFPALNSLRNRMLLFFLAVIMFVVLLTLQLVRSATYKHSTEQLLSQTQTSASVVEDKVENRADLLLRAADNLSQNFTMKQYIGAAGEDPESLFVAMQNHQSRIDADMFLVLDADKKLLVSSIKEGGQIPEFPEQFNQDFGGHLRSYVSTDAQGDWWGGAGGGTIAHAAIACFLSDTAATMLAFAEFVPAEVSRIALVDFNNDSLQDGLRTMEKMFERYLPLMQSGQEEEAQKYVLFGVRLDTSGSQRDVSVPPLGDPLLDLGVTPRLVFNMRQALDTAWKSWNLQPDQVEMAKAYCQNVRIVVTGGFGPEKIRKFEKLQVPADIYGVGSSLLLNDKQTNTDFTADVVRVKINGEWHDMAKIGRQACDNPELMPVDLAQF